MPGKKTLGVIALIAGLVVFVVYYYAPSFSEEKKGGFEFKSRPETASVRPQKAAKKPIKIKLRRLSDGTYTWELSGDDTEEIIRTDRRLRKSFEVNGGKVENP